MGGQSHPVSSSKGILASAERHPGFLTLLYNDQAVYQTRGYDVWVRLARGPSVKSLATLQVPWHIKRASRLSYLRRLGRLWVRELIRVEGDFLVAAARKLTRAVAQADLPMPI